jgi:hypothetical protein
MIETISKTIGFLIVSLCCLKCPILLVMIISFSGFLFLTLSRLRFPADDGDIWYREHMKSEEKDEEQTEFSNKDK